MAREPQGNILWPIPQDLCQDRALSLESGDVVCKNYMKLSFSARAKAGASYYRAPLGTKQTRRDWVGWMSKSAICSFSLGSLLRFQKSEAEVPQLHWWGLNC